MRRPVTIQIKESIAWVTLDNPPVNATSTALRAGLLDAVEQVQGCDLAVLRAAGRTFVAGGDLSEFDSPQVEPHLPDVVASIEASAVPFLALLHGAVLGGGFEIAMACAFRVAKPGTRFGLPEVKLGLVPGAGGTQRAPRLLGWQLAFEMACLGQTKTAEQLLEVGGIDRIAADLEAAVKQFTPARFTPARFTLEQSIRGQFNGRPAPKLSQQLSQQPSRQVLRQVSLRPLDPLSAAQRSQFDREVRKFARGRSAPGLALTALSWASEPYAQAQPKERALHLKQRQSAESKALRYLFFAERRVSNPPAFKAIQPGDVATVAVVGGGLMGSGIAAACLSAGYRVSIIERDAQAADEAARSVRALLHGAVTRGKITQQAFAQQLAALTCGDSDGLAAAAELVIEAVFEDRDAKRTVFQSLARVVKPEALLATNSSYLNPDELFDGVSGSHRCLGLHFFSPAQIMKLVEVVKASQTSVQSLATAFAFAKSLQKIPVQAGIGDGFIGNRILAAYRRAAEYLLADGALPSQIDAAMRAFGMAMGPFEAQDLAGLQIAQANRRRQDASRPPSERYVTIADQLCELGRFGRRAGAGWYRYPKVATRGEPDPEVEQIIANYSLKMGITRRAFSDEEIQRLLLAAMVNEGAGIVEAGVAQSYAAVDVVKTAGYGFPSWRGGPMYWAEVVGRDAVCSALATLAAASPGSWRFAAAYQD